MVASELVCLTERQRLNLFANIDYHSNENQPAKSEIIGGKKIITDMRHSLSIMSMHMLSHTGPHFVK
jgi:hypothetical protein